MGEGQRIHMAIPLSVVIITKNEAHNIEACINSVRFVDDIVVLDSGSTDATREVAAGLGAKVFAEEWRGFGPQKRRAVELALHDWVLSLDADEALDIDAQDFLKTFAEEVKSELTPAAYKFERESFHLGRWIKHGGWSPDYQIRLFNRLKANWSHDLVHEKVVTAGEIGKAKGKIKHWVFTNLAHQIDTNNRYSTLGAEALYAKGVKFSLSKLIFKPYSKFIETYIVKGGFRDGLPGFIISVGAAYSVFLKFAKLWELEQANLKDQG